MLNITHYQRNANQNHNEVLFHASEWLRSKSLQVINAGEGVEKRKPSPAFIVCRLFDSSYSDRREMVPHSGFDLRLHFSDSE